MIDSLIFLDIDGVMLTGRMMRAQQAIREGKENALVAIYRERLRGGGPTPFDPEALDALDWLCEMTGAQIVLSSTWREGKWDGVKESLRIRGFRREMLSRTPVLSRKVGSLWVAPTRGEEIMSWCAQYKSDTGRRVAFVILDDDADMGALLPLLVQTDFESGLTSGLARRAEQILREERKRLTGRRLA